MKYIISSLVLVSFGCANVEGEEPFDVGQRIQNAKAVSFEVDFESCTEFAGIGLVPAENASPYVPTGYDLATSGTDALIVVRSVECANISVDGKAGSPGKLSQIGLSVSGADTSADINNYTLWYVTNHALLHSKLRGAGLNSVKEPGLEYTLAPGLPQASLTLASSNARTPEFTATGLVSEPTGDPTSFIATWWEDGRHGTIRSRTEFPEITFTYDGSITLTTSAGSELASLIGGTTLNFPLLNSYNAFDYAAMEVTLE